MKRLFLAIDFPEAITDLLVSLNPRLPGVRWLQAGQIHLTISFLGNVHSEAEEILRERLATIRFKAFFLPVVGLGCFPTKGKPNVIWAGVANGHPQLFHVHQRVQDAVLGAGLEADLRPWHPHITLARCRDVSPNALHPFLKANVNFDAGLVRIESFALYSSIPGPHGSNYTRELEMAAA